MLKKGSLYLVILLIASCNLQKNEKNILVISSNENIKLKTEQMFGIA